MNRMTPKIIDPIILQEVIAILSVKFQIPIEIKSIKILTNEGRRNLVARISILHTSSKMPKTIIFKQSKIDKSSKDDVDRFSRDWAGLEFSSNLKTPTPITPKFYGASKNHRFILIEDLGAMSTSLVDSLMGNNLLEAKKALNRYMIIMA
jgi:hypothetical protein